MSRLKREAYVVVGALLLIVISILLFGGEVDGRTITVDDDGVAEYDNIQDAVDAADDGDTVRVFDGFYEESVLVNKSIDLVGSGSESTTIQAKYEDYTVLITANGVNLSHFSITGSDKRMESGILIESSYVTIRNTNCSDNYYGIYFDDASKSVASFNTCENNYLSIRFDNSDNCTVDNNTCLTSEYTAIYLKYSRNFRISNNTTDRGILIFSDVLEHWNTHAIEVSNTVGGKRISYFKNTRNFNIPSGAGQVILVNCSQVTVENQNCSNTSTGINVFYSSFITINNITCFNNFFAIKLELSDNCTIENNTCSETTFGIYLRKSRNCFISRNSCNKSKDYGIYLYESEQCTIPNNICEKNDNAGIYLRFSTMCRIENNSCNESKIGSGIHLEYSENSTIANNTCAYSRYRGIGLSDSSNSEIENNKCLMNTDAGIFISKSPFSRIYNNICNDSKYGIDIIGSNSCKVANNFCFGTRIYSGIRVKSSSSCMVISNDCSGNIATYEEGGILLDKSANCIIMRNNCSGNHNGICLVDSKNNIIEENNCSVNSVGIKTIRSSGCMVRNNSCTSNEDYGIVTSSNHNTIEANVCSYNNDAGIFITSAKNCTVKNNICDYNAIYGIRLTHSEYCTLVNNTMQKGGISLKYWSILPSWYIHRIDTSNQVNGKPVYYYLNLSHFSVPSGAGQVILVNCSEVIVENQNCSDVSIGITIALSADVIIRNNTCTNNSVDGIYIDHSPSCVIANNSCSNNIENGIYIYKSKHIKISYNTLSLNMNGITLFLRFDSCEIEYNQISFNNIGLFLERENNDTQIQSNNLHNNSLFGIDATLNPEYQILAKQNYWGEENGPYHPTKNVDGEGDNITDNIEYEPWLNESMKWISRAHIWKISPNPGIEGKRIRFSGFTANAGTIDRYVWQSNIDGEFYNSTEEEFYCDNLSIGKHTIIFKAVNSSGNWTEADSQRINITRKPQAIIDQVSPNPGLKSLEVTFEGHAIDDGSIVRFVWHSSLDGELYNKTSSTFKSTDLANGTHTISFKVQDNHGFWSYEVFETLHINGIPVAYISNISAQSLLEGEPVNLTGNGTDDGTIVRRVWHSSIDGEFYNGTEQSVIISSLSNGTHTISYRVSDNNGTWSQEVVETIRVNGIPRSFIQLISPNQIALDTEIVFFNGTGTDDGTIQRYLWHSTLDGVLHNHTNSDFSTGILSVGTHTITLKIQDDFGIWSEEVSAVLIVTEKPNATIINIAPDPALLNTIVSLNGNGTDDGTIEQYQWRSTIDGELYNGTLSTFTTDSLSVGEHTIFFSVMDNYGIWTDEIFDILIVTEKPISTIDSITPNPTLDAIEVSFEGHGTDDGTIDRHVWHSNLDGELYNDSVASFQSTTLSVGDHTISLKVQDNHGFWSDGMSISLVVTEKPVAHLDSSGYPVPILDSNSDGIAFTISGTDDGTIVRYSCRSNLDGELYNDSTDSFQTGLLSAGNHTFYFKVQDNHGFWSDEVSQSLEVLKDTDEDNVPDIDDAFPNDQTEWEDTDSDGIGDNADAFPTDPAASKDTDGDTYPDEWNVGKTTADSTTELKLDAYPDNPDKWKKESSDSPGFGIVVVCAALIAVVIFCKRTS